MGIADLTYEEFKKLYEENRIKIKNPVGRPKGAKWDRIFKTTIRLYDASREDIAYIRGVVKRVQAEIYKRNGCKAE